MAKETAVSIKSNNDKGIEAIAKVGEWDREAFASDTNNIVYGANFPVGTSTTKVIQSFFNIKLTNNNVYSARITIDATKAYNAGETAGKSIGHDEARANYISYVPSTPSSWNPLIATPGNIQTSGNYKYVQAQFNLTAGH